MGGAFALTLTFSGIIYYVRNKNRKVVALARVISGTLVLAEIIGASTYYGWSVTHAHSHEHDNKKSLKLALLGTNVTQKIGVIEHLKKNPDEPYLLTPLEELKNADSKRVKNHILISLSAYEGKNIEIVLSKQTNKTTASSLKLSMTTRLLRRKNENGFNILLDITE